MYFEKHATNTLISLELHLTGKAVMAGNSSSKVPQQDNPLLVKAGSYRTLKVSFKRSIEFQCNLIYNPLNRKITVKNAAFGTHLYRNMIEDYHVECGKPVKSPQLIPRSHKFLHGNLMAILLQPPETVPQNYQENPQSPYIENPYPTTKPKGPYAETLNAPYAHYGPQTYIKDQFKKATSLPNNTNQSFLFTRIFDNIHKLSQM